MSTNSIYTVVTDPVADPILDLGSDPEMEIPLSLADLLPDDHIEDGFEIVCFKEQDDCDMDIRYYVKDEETHSLTSLQTLASLDSSLYSHLTSPLSSSTRQHLRHLVSASRTGQHLASLVVDSAAPRLSHLDSAALRAAPRLSDEGQR
ncbi:hypothetical protein ACLB2K_073831 [Fragaria x ananassa]